MIWCGLKCQDVSVASVKLSTYLGHLCPAPVCYNHCSL